MRQPPPIALTANSNLREITVSPNPALKSPEPVTGWVCGIAAYMVWGLNLLYFKAVQDVPIQEVLLHRVIWSVVILAIVLAFMGGWRNVGRHLLAPRLLVISAALIAANWLIYNYAAITGQALQASFGYFINPLVNVLFGVALLGERLSIRRWLAVSLATLGVLVQAYALGGIPWISLTLAGSFGCYGLVRKWAKVDGLTGVMVEMLLLLPIATLGLGYIAAIGQSSFAAGSLATDSLLMMSGLMTGIPMVLFGAAAVRLRLSTLGILQYIAPTGQFLLAVLVYHEPLSSLRLASFALIWLALAIYLIPERAKVADPETAGQASEPEQPLLPDAEEQPTVAQPASAASA